MRPPSGGEVAQATYAEEQKAHEAAFLGALHKAVAGLLFSAEKVKCNFEGRGSCAPNCLQQP